jgi:signal peptidase I
MAGGSNVVAAGAREWPRSARRIAHTGSTFLLWAALGLAIGLLAIVTLPGMLGYRSLTVVSGSMEPTLRTGSVVIDEVISPADARPGDIVTFQDPVRPRQLTHRLQKVRVEGDTYFMVTLGDANDAPERWTVPADGRLGRVVAHLPRLGYARAAVSTRYARLGALGAVLALGAMLLVDLWRPPRRTGE